MATAAAKTDSIHLTPTGLGRLFNVTAQCIRTWERDGKIPASERTMGGHRRYSQLHIDHINARLQEAQTQRGS